VIFLISDRCGAVEIFALFEDIFEIIFRHLLRFDTVAVRFEYRTDQIGVDSLTAYLSENEWRYVVSDGDFEGFRGTEGAEKEKNQ